MSQKCQQSRNKNGEQWLACHIKGSFVLEKRPGLAVLRPAS